jgi:hypothetical protein
MLASKASRKKKDAKFSKKYAQLCPIFGGHIFLKTIMPPTS